MSGASTSYPFPVPPGRSRRTPFAQPVGELRSTAAPAAPGNADAATRPRPITPPMLDADDPRWVLALRVREQMQGVLLTPDSRSRLDQLGRVMGLTPFEVNLVIAIVQDQARRGGDLDAAAPSLAMVPRYRSRRSVNRWQVAGWVTALLAVELGAILLLRATLFA